MPFTPYKHSLDPETLHAAYEAFDMGWAEISKAQNGCDLELARDLLAKLIVEAALNGERDAERLKAYALEGFSH